MDFDAAPTPDEEAGKPEGGPSALLRAAAEPVTGRKGRLAGPNRNSLSVRQKISAPSFGPDNDGHRGGGSLPQSLLEQAPQGRDLLLVHREVAVLTPTVERLHDGVQLVELEKLLAVP